MRFPRLSHLFHRRAKSEPELSRLAATPIVTPKTRPASDPYLSESLVRPTDVFTTYIPPAPLTFPIPEHHSQNDADRAAPLQSPFYVQPPAGGLPHSRSIVSVLTHRIRDLEGALHEARESHQAALQANESLANDAAIRQSEVVELRRKLFSVLAGGAPQGPAPAHSDDELELSALALENAALLAECDRLRRFVEIMGIASDAQPTIASAYASVLAGDEPEAALVQAIKSAAAQPDSAWRALLEPVTGVRTQDEYLAQVRCTLDARAQTRDWRKRAAFWRRAAKEDARHAETVTPSVSALSETTEALPLDRRQKVQEMKEALQRGLLPLRVNRDKGAPAETNRAVGVPVPSASAGESMGESNSSPPVLSASPTPPSDEDLPALAALQSCADITAADALTNCLPASSSSMVLPSVSSSGSTAHGPPVSPVAHTNLPPLASETFRTSHSIKSVSSRGSGRSFLAASTRTPSHAPSSLDGRNLREGISASASASTQGSAKSWRRRAKIVAVPVTSASVPKAGGLAASTTKSTSRWSFFAPSRSAASAVASLEDAKTVCAEEPRDDGALLPRMSIATPMESNSTETVPSREGSVDTVVAMGCDPETPTRASPCSLPKALVDFNDSLDDDLVLVLHSDFSGSSYRGALPTGPHGSASSPTSARGQSPSSANTTPEKRSRLPVRMRGLRAIKRFSASINISRPVLVETTNAGTVGFGPVVPEGAAGKKNGDGPLRARAPSVAGRPGFAGASPPRPSKIPMGRKLQRFALGG